MGKDWAGAEKLAHKKSTNGIKWIGKIYESIFVNMDSVC